MKKKIFDKGLYLDSLRRTAVIGGLLTVLLTVAALLIFFAYTMDLQYLDQSNISIEVVNFIEIHPVILAVPFLLVPLLCLNLFGFMNKRSTSDFWHSVPFTRCCLFNTFCAAVITWALAAIVISGSVSVLCFSVLPRYFAVNWASVLTTVLAVAAASLLSMTGVCIAMSITGTYFSNVIVSLIVLFLPRVLMLFFSYTSTNSTLFEMSLDDSLLSPTYNILAGTVLSLEDVPEMVCSWPSIIYTAVIGIIYYGLGISLFYRRKSEAASYSAVNTYMQAAFRIIVCMTVCLVPIYLITMNLNSLNRYLSGEDSFYILVLYVVALAAYFIYELITTKKLKNLVKAIPALGIVVLLNLLLIGGSHVAYRVEYDYTPTPATVSEIRFGFGEKYINNYFEYAVSATPIADNDIEQILCDSYIRTRTRYETGYLFQEDYEIMTVGFKTNGNYHYRNVWVSTEDFEKLSELLYNNKNYREIYDPEKLISKALATSLNIHLPYNTDEQGYIEIDENKVIEAYLNDVKSMDFSEWYYLANHSYYNEIPFTDNNGESKYASVVAFIDGSIAVGAENTYFDLAISNLTPTAYNMVMNAVFKNQDRCGQQQKLLDELTSVEFTEKDIDMKYIDINIELYNGITMGESEYYTIDSKEKLEKLVEILNQSKGQVPTAQSRYAKVYYHKAMDDIEAYDKQIYEFESFSAVFLIPDNADLMFLLQTDTLK